MRRRSMIPHRKVWTAIMLGGGVPFVTIVVMFGVSAPCSGGMCPSLMSGTAFMIGHFGPGPSIVRLGLRVAPYGPSDGSPTGLMSFGAVSSCDDGNPCTDDSGDPETGCVHVPAADRLCDDGNACTLNDICSAGMCGGFRPAGAVSAGEDDTCAVRQDGRIKCWGADDQEGVSGPNASAETYAAISSTGGRQTCAVRRDGRLACWGADLRGEVSGPNGDVGFYTTVATGYETSCALRQDQKLVCWGAITIGPDGSASRYIALSAGGYLVCAVQLDGSLDCWLGSCEPDIPPEACGGQDPPWAMQSHASTGQEAVTDVSVGLRHVCTVKRDGNLFCWYSAHGPWEIFESGQVSGPNASTGPYVAVGAGLSHTCALRLDGRLNCWGADPYGAVSGPNGSTGRYVALHVGARHTCALEQDGRLACWGSDGSGQVSGPNEDSEVYGPPMLSCEADEVDCTLDWCDPSSGCAHAPVATACTDGNPCTFDACDQRLGCTHESTPGAWCDDGDACTTSDACVGDTCVGGPPPACDDGNPCTDTVGCDPATGCIQQPAVGRACDDGDACTLDDTCSAGVCNGFTAADSLSTSENQTCAVRSDGTLVCWGDDSYGQVSGPSASTERCAAVSVGGYHTCAVRLDGRLACWGYDTYGQISGPNASPDSYTAVSAGAHHTCAVRLDGRLACWGDDFSERDSGPNASPDSYAAVSVGAAHTCAVRRDGRLACWGYDTYGQISGPNASPDSHKAVSSGGDYTCAVRLDGRLACWGHDTYGEISGPNASSDSYTGVSAGAHHTCAVRSDGRLTCWGDDFYGSVSGPNASTEIHTAVSAGVIHTCAVRLDGRLICWGYDSYGQVSGPNGDAAGYGPSVRRQDCDDGLACTVDSCEPSAGCVHTVVDSTPPALAVQVTPSTLWPPNHEMVPVRVGFQAWDDCDPSPRVELVAVTSSESDDEEGMGDGATTKDVDGADLGGSDFDLWLRAERDGKGSGRIYRLDYRAVDASGNATPAVALVTVPHDQGQLTEPLLLSVKPEDGPSRLIVSWGSMPSATAYDVIRGDLGALRLEGRVVHLGQVGILGHPDGFQTQVEDVLPSPTPPVGSGYFYLIQAWTVAGPTGYGTESCPWPRRPDP